MTVLFLGHLRQLKSTTALNIHRKPIIIHSKYFSASDWLKFHGKLFINS